MAEIESPTPMTNDELVEACLILIQKLFAENRINDVERDHLKGKYSPFDGSLGLIRGLPQDSTERVKFGLPNCDSRIDLTVHYIKR